MCARLIAQAGGPLRQIAFAPNGDLFGATLEGVVLLFRDANGDGVYAAGEIHRWAENGTIFGNNVHLTATHVYAGGEGRVVRWPYVPGALAAAGAPEPVVVGLPVGGGHVLHTVHVYDGSLYVHAGSADNMDAPADGSYDSNRSLLRRFTLSSFAPGSPLSWSAGENVTLGIRNMVGFTRNAAGRMYGVVNGMDFVSYATGGVFEDVHEDNPGEQVVELLPGKRYGYPYCFTSQRVTVGGKIATPGTQLPNPGSDPSHDAAWCAASSELPATFVQAHSAPLDILFFDVQPKGVLPERWRGGAFIAFHGSANRSIPTGYKVVWMPFDAAGKAPMPTSTDTGTIFPYETVFGRGSPAEGAVDGAWYWTDGDVEETPRPAGIAISPVDGALYVSSDQSGFLYRVGMGP
jgi:glucose/arabinose dehydrogenase